MQIVFDEYGDIFDEQQQKEGRKKFNIKRVAFHHFCYKVDQSNGFFHLSDLFKAPFSVWESCSCLMSFRT